ncbi:uncharacterized protein Z519_12054 [Cladophialophora bantiana CBS 173.52]|uniref:Uncharacterized protein n=1 Tax=Cladophialophora bantiana (strain ATCC 10958 / CBS 173.52 / CDC B-1940 / NIH 8579) TaxID=1442370 RepID=A0A0D2H277_CLAB1|nr:uncharacterized protein Z519_12054 [Cladophialophora bantiana CBS 173.52]KIW87418.1 hypothetical protein Z519_12054 [Cladophialophora bantiana CBS 173.52]
MAPEKRTVLITGCSDGGLGAALALAFHKQGDRVFATARTPSKMSSLQSLGIETLPLDVLSEESIRTCVEKVSSLTGGSLDILVNNAGAGFNMPVLDIPIAEIRRQFELNVFSALRVIQLFFPLLRDSTTKNKMIVNNTSCGAVLTLPFMGPYSASKAALASFSETLRLEMQAFGIKVIDLRTAGVRSKFFDNVNVEMSPTLPENSPYSPGKDIVEKFISQGPSVRLMDADVWAKNVVRDLSKRGGKGAPHQIWRGQGATSAWFSATAVPVGWMDGVVKKFSGLDMVERRIEEKENMA